MNEQPKNLPSTLSPDRRVVVWNFVKRAIEKAGRDSRASDAQGLVAQQIRTAVDDGGKE
jgi:hypothetical protein